MGRKFRVTKYLFNKSGHYDSDEDISLVEKRFLSRQTPVKQKRSKINYPTRGKSRWKLSTLANYNLVHVHGIVERVEGYASYTRKV